MRIAWNKGLTKKTSKKIALMSKNLSKIKSGKLPEHLKIHVFSKGQKAWNFARVKIICEFCHKTFEVPPIRKYTAKHCSRKCHNTFISRNWDHRDKKNPMWKGGIQTYRKFKKKFCEKCKSEKFLIVHHKDSNRYNNILKNLQTLCRSCHAKGHGVAKNFYSSSPSFSQQ